MKPTIIIKRKDGKEEIEKRPEHTFKNGAKYIGTWLGGEENVDVRHG